MAPELLPQRCHGVVPSGRIAPAGYLQPASVRRGRCGPSLAESSRVPPVGYLQPPVCRCRRGTDSTVASLHPGGCVYVFGPRGPVAPARGLFGVPVGVAPTPDPFGGPAVARAPGSGWSEWAMSQHYDICISSIGQMVAEGANIC